MPLIAKAPLFCAPALTFVLVFIVASAGFYAAAAGDLTAADALRRRPTASALVQLAPAVTAGYAVPAGHVLGHE